jgi:hypothetical protein
MSPTLEYPTEPEIRWLFTQGVPDTAMLEPTPIRAANVVFLDGNTFDVDSGGARTFTGFLESISTPSEGVKFLARFKSRLTQYPRGGGLAN